MRVWRQAGQFEAQRGRALAWIISIARYRAIDMQRGRKDWVGLEAVAEPSVSAGPNRVLADAALARALPGIADRRAAALSGAGLPAGAHAGRYCDVNGVSARNGQELGTPRAHFVAQVPRIMNYEQAGIARGTCGCLRGGEPARRRHVRDSNAPAPRVTACGRRCAAGRTSSCPCITIWYRLPQAPRVWEHIPRRITSQVAAARDAAHRWRWALIGALALSVLVAVSIRLLYPPYQVVAAVGSGSDFIRCGISRAPKIRAH